MQDQETMPLLARRRNDPPTADFTLQRRHPLELFWRAKFNELAEQEQALSSILAHVETNVETTKIELQEKLTSIIDSLSQLNHMSNKMERLQQEMNTKQERYEEIKTKETTLEGSIKNLEEKIVGLESANQFLRRERVLFDVLVVALTILTGLVLHHIFFG